MATTNDGQGESWDAGFSDLAALSLEAVASSATTTSANAGAGATRGLAVGQSSIAQVRETMPAARLVINLDRVMRGCKMQCK